MSVPPSQHFDGLVTVTYSGQTWRGLGTIALRPRSCGGLLVVVTQQRGEAGFTTVFPDADVFSVEVADDFAVVRAQTGFEFQLHGVSARSFGAALGDVVETRSPFG